MDMGYVGEYRTAIYNNTIISKSYIGEYRNIAIYKETTANRDIYKASIDRCIHFETHTVEILKQKIDRELNTEIDLKV
jgi:hypothetical protein